MNILLTIANKRQYTEDERQNYTKEKLDGLFKGVITEQEFSFIFEEYIFSRINDYAKVDLVIVSYSCVMTPFNKRTNNIFQLSEEVFFNIFTNLARRTNFRMLFVPRLIINTYEEIEEISHKINYPATLKNQVQYVKNDQQEKQTLLEEMKTELIQYEDDVRQIFGINQIKNSIANSSKVKYSYENQDLIKYVQNISCGFFQYFNTLNTFASKSNKSVFTNKIKNALDWRYVNSIVYMNSVLHNLKNKKNKEKKHNLGYFKKEYKYFIEVLKNMERVKVDNFSNTKSLGYQRELENALEFTDVIYLMKPSSQINKSTSKDKEIYEENEMKVKKYKIINSLSKPCFLNKFSQHYVDYKNEVVYFFNILFSGIDANENQLSQTLANCFGRIPEDPNDEEIQIQKIQDWQFSSITLGQNDLLQDKRTFFLQDSTIISCSQFYEREVKQNEKERLKTQFLLFFGGKINYFDKQKSEINLNDEKMFKSSNLYALKIRETLGKTKHEIFQFYEIKIFGDLEIVQNISYSSGASITQQNTDQKENYLFIFGGQYEGNHGECTLQNVILFSNISKTLLEIINVSEQKRNSQSFTTSSGQTLTQTVDALSSDSSQNTAITVKTATTSIVDKINQIKFQYNSSTKDDFKEITEDLENIDELRDILDKFQLQEINIFLMQLQSIQKIDEVYIQDSKQNVYLNYAIFLCYKILRQYNNVKMFLDIKENIKPKEYLIIQLCKENPNKIVYYLSHILQCSKIKSEDLQFKNIQQYLQQIQETSSIIKKDEKQIKMDLEYYSIVFNPSLYTLDERKVHLENQIIERRKIFEQIEKDRKKEIERNKQNISGNENIKVLPTYQEIKIFAHINLLLSDIYQAQQNEIRTEAYKTALEYYEKIRKTTISQRQINFFSAVFKQIPKQSLTHLDSIKSVCMRKAFVLKQKNQKFEASMMKKNQAFNKTRNDTRILLIGGTISKFLNYSDKNKVEVAHFFYPVLYINYLINLKNNQNISNVKTDIKPETGFIQKIELNQQFCPQWIASMNHNYIVKAIMHFKTVDCQNKDSQDQNLNAFIESIQKDQTGQTNPIQLNQILFEQMHVEIRAIESSLLKSQKEIYIKNVENIGDESESNFNFKQTIFEVYQEQSNENQNEKIKESDQPNEKKSQNEQKVNEEKEIFKAVQGEPNIYDNKETQIDEKLMVQKARRLNEICIQNNELNKQDYIENLKNKIHVDQNQKFNACYFTSISMVLESIFPLNPQSYQAIKQKPKSKAKAFFWEIMKQYNSKQQNLNIENHEMSTKKSLIYESQLSKIIFNQECIKCLTSNGEISQFFGFSLNSKPLHQNETDNFMNIFWKTGSSKLIIYDNIIQKFLQVQLMIDNQKQGEKIIPEIGQIKNVFLNNKDNHLYIYVEEEWQYNYQNVLMRAPLQNIHSPYQEILFREVIFKQSIRQTQLSFSIDSNDKIFGISQEQSQRIEASHSESHSESHSFHEKKTFILFKDSLEKVINIEEILDQFSQICGSNIERFEIDCLIAGEQTKNKTEQVLVSLYLALLNRNAQLIIEDCIINNIEYLFFYTKRNINIFILKQQDKIDEEFEPELNVSQLLGKLEKLLKNSQKQKNNFESSQFKCLKIKKQEELLKNHQLLEIAINFLCEQHVCSFISSSFNQLILGGLLVQGSCFNKLKDSDYKIQYLDISSLIVNTDSCYDGILEFLSQKGQYLKYLNISKQRNLLRRIIQSINSPSKDYKIRFDSLLFLDISDVELISKFILVDLIQYLLHICYQLKGINMNKIFEEGTDELLISFDYLSNQSFSSYYPSDYDLQVYIEKIGQNTLQNYDDRLIDQLKGIFGDKEPFTQNDQRLYQNLKIKSKNTSQEAKLSERIAKIYINIETFYNPIVFSSERQYLIFESQNYLLKDKEHYYFTFCRILQDQVSAINIQNIKNDEVIKVLFKKQYFKKLTILNISKYLSDDSEKFTIFGIVEYLDNRKYICRMEMPVPQQDIPQENIKFYKSKSNIKNFTDKWIHECYIPLTHNKKIKNIFLCVKDVYQEDGYSFFKADELQELK